MGEPDDSMTLGLTASGSQTGAITYQDRLADEAWSISGTWNDHPAVLPRLP